MRRREAPSSIVIALKLPARRPISSCETTGTVLVRSPAATISTPAASAPTGRSTMRQSTR